MHPFPDTTLVVLGHGSTVNDDSAAPTQMHAGTLRALKRFAAVQAAFWKQAPLLADVLKATNTPRVVVVPLFISEGYFTRQAIPQAMGFNSSPDTPPPLIRSGSGRTFILTAPVGSHASMTSLLRRRAAEIVDEFPFPFRPRPQDTSLFVAGHGTERSAQSRLAIDQQVETLREMGEYAEVQPCFIEEPPAIADVPKIARAKNVVVAPFFMADGLHVAEDIPLLLGEPEATVRKRLAAGQPAWRNPTERNGKRIWVARAIGSHPGIADIILQLATDALAGSAG